LEVHRIEAHEAIDQLKIPVMPKPVPEEAPTEKPRLREHFRAPFFLTFFISLATWLVLSGKFDVFHLSLGVISCFIVAFFSGDIMFPNPELAGYPRMALRFVAYIPWLLYQIWVSNWHVLRLVFHPRMMDLIDPRIIRFKSGLSGDMARLVLANSITLTPGTITVFVSALGAFTVHVIDKKSAEGLTGDMERRIARIYGE
jgi:multicomponent Na+:H+ antiporter subunit E